MKYSELTTEERDRLVAEKVFRHDIICKGKLSYLGHGGDRYYCRECLAEITMIDKLPESHQIKCPPYSTDLNIA